MPRSCLASCRSRPPRAVAGRVEEVSACSERCPADLYVDAILGTGFKPPVSGLYAEAISLLNASQEKVIAVDIPSGADADAMGRNRGIIARSDVTVTFTRPRPRCLNDFNSVLTRGPTYVAGIGSPKRSSSLHLNVIHPRDFAPMIGPRPAESNRELRACSRGGWICRQGRIGCDGWHGSVACGGGAVDRSHGEVSALDRRGI